MLRTLFFSLSVLLPFAAPAADGNVSAADLAEIRGVIHRQIDAFRRDDAPGAFALVSPGVQQAFGTPERFLDTVRAAYRAVYRPSAVAFRELVVMGGDVVQRADDTPEAIQKRLDLYERETTPLIAWYQDRGLLSEVDGYGSADEVTARLVEVIDEARRARP